MLKYNVQVYFPLSSYLNDNEKLCLGLFKSVNLLSSFFIRAPNVRGRIQKKEKEN